MTDTTINGVDFGPLAGLVGIWDGDRGMDVAPEPDGVEKSPYYETVTFEAVGDVDNAEKQHLAVVRYQQIVKRKSNDEVFHDQTGYWLWDAATGVVMQSVSIPRAVTLLAGGDATTTDKGITLKVQAKLGDPDWGIVQSPFMRDNASTVSFEHELTVNGDQMAYSETSLIDIYGKPQFEHTDRNKLVRRQ